MNGVAVRNFPRTASMRLPQVPDLVSATSAFKATGFFALHAALALLMFKFQQVATAHALVTPVAGAAWLLGKRHVERAAYVGAYIAGSEVLWRMTDAQVFWEFGKYSIVAIFILALVRSHSIKWSLLPLAYFLVLLPSVYLSLERLNLEAARKSLSFNLSGPFSLMVCVFLFSNLKWTPHQLYKFFLGFVGPVVGIASITALTTFTMKEITRADVADKVTSGGFGPNQVSAVLGLGVLFAILMLMDSKTGLTLKVLMFGTMIALGVQSAITFSRGGLYMAAGGAILASFYLVRKPGTRIRLILAVVAIFLITNFLLLPFLDSFTGGSLSARFLNTSSTGRDQIVLADLEIWKKSPIFGVGPGVSMFHRSELLKWVAAHTEYSRLLAEHGLFGLVAILLLIAMAVQALRRGRITLSKALAAAMLGWSFMFMLIDGMRLVAPSLVFGLSFVSFYMPSAVSRQLSRSPLRLNRQVHLYGYQPMRGTTRVGSATGARVLGGTTSGRR